MRAHSWILLVAACGNNGTHHLADGGADAPRGIDAVVPDVGVDAPTAGPVTLLLTVNGAPGSGATVYFQNADSSPVAELATGADGKATQVMEPGGFVTVVAPQVAVAAVSPQNQELDTFAGVKPGDVLLVDVGDTLVTTANVTVTAPLDPNPSAVSYQLATTCSGGQLLALGTGSGSGSGSAALAKTAKTARKQQPRAKPRALAPTTIALQDCGATADMLVISLDGSGNQLDAFFAPAVAVSDGGSVTLTGTYAAVPTQAVTFDQIPNGETVASANLGQFLVSGDRLLVATAPTYLGTAPTVTTSLAQPAVTGGVAGLETQFTDSAGLSQQTFAAWGPQSATAVTADVTASRLPDYAAVPSFDVASQQVRWATTGGGSASVDSAYAFFNVQRAPGDGGLASWSWAVVAPGAQAGALQVPTLPTDLFAWSPVATDTIIIDDVEMAHVSGGYDAVRADGIDEDYDAALDLTTPAGAVVLDYFQSAVGTDLAGNAGRAHRGRRATIKR